MPAATAAGDAGATGWLEAAIPGTNQQLGVPGGQNRHGREEAAASRRAPPALRLVTSTADLSALLAAHVTVGPQEDPEVASLWPWDRESPAGTPVASRARARPETPALPPLPAAHPAAMPPELEPPRIAPRAAAPVDEQVVDAVLERLEDRMREEAIRRFGLTGGEP